MAAYTALIMILIVLIVGLAVLFICLRSSLGSRTDQPASVQPSDIQAAAAAAIVYSRRGFAPSLVITRPHRYQRHSGKIPTPPTIISNLPCVNYEAPSHDGPDGKDTTAEDELPQCVICCCAFQEQEKVKLLPCLHMYHEECIDAWLQRDHICPVCQSDVILAAGLSLQADWSAHTLASVNIVSGTARHDTPAAAAAAPAAGARPSTAPAAVSSQAHQQQSHELDTAAAPAVQAGLPVEQLAAQQSSAGSRVEGSSIEAGDGNEEHVLVTIRPATAAGAVAL